MTADSAVSPVKLFARDLSPWLKIASAIVGFVAAYFWLRSARTSGPDSIRWNWLAALTTGGAVFLQGLSALIDWWIPPQSTW